MTKCDDEVINETKCECNKRNKMELINRRME